MKLATLLQHSLMLNEISIANEIEITKVTHNSREVSPGCLFICLKGTQVDGHNFIADAVAAGAAAILGENIPASLPIPFIQVSNSAIALAQIANLFYQKPAVHLKMFGVTGTNGKTTVTHLINQILENLEKKTGLIGSLYNKINQRQLPTGNTTPDSLTTQSLLADMLLANVTHCAMEVSSHGLMQHRVTNIEFDVVVFTNLSQDHLDFHGTMGNYFDAKKQLFNSSTQDCSTKNKTAIINCDDLYGQRLITELSEKYYTFGCYGSGDFQAKNISSTSAGSHFDLEVFNETFPITIPLVGEFNIYNVLAAIAAIYASGLPLLDIISGLSQLTGVPGRFELVPSHNQTSYFVDYAHTPAGLKNILTAVDHLTTGKVFCIIGCGGQRDSLKRPLMAQIALENSFHVIFTNDNPRNESPEKIIEDMLHNNQLTNYHVEMNRKKAIVQGIALAGPGDTLLVAGKGHETFQLIGTQVLPFDDRQVIIENLLPLY